MFGQFAYCNAPAFFTAANAAVKAGKLAVPALGTARDGKVCPTTRDFSVVDMDQSDNVTAAYLVLKNGTLAQNTAANRAKFNGGRSHVLVNGSDNLLLDGFVDAALGCTPFTAPDLADPNATSTSLALNELQAAKQAAPVAVVPPTDPMAMDGTKASLGKTNLYRDGVNQPSLAAIGSSGKDYCRNLVDVAPQRIQLDRNLTTKTTSPDKAAANNLFTFLAQRLRQSFITLNCRKLLGTRNPVRLVLDKNGVAVDATFTKPVAALPANTAPMDNPLSAQIAADPAAAQPIEF